MSWDNFNESGDFKTQVEAYKKFTGYYPSSVHVDRIYRTRENRAWCKERGIRISRSPLGRPPKNVSKETKKQALDDERGEKNLGVLQRLDGCTHPSMDRFQDPLNFNSFYERFRNGIEGKFGQAKRRYGLNCIMAKLSETAETSIAITFLVINLSTLLRQVNCLFLSLFLQDYKLGLISEDFIIKTDIKPYLLA